MASEHREFKNILLIHFGQLGDVVLSLPAIRAVRARFAEAKLTIMSGLSTRGVIEISGLADEQIAVDRVKMRDGGKIAAFGDMFDLVRELRRRKFDLVIDIHSLYETNLTAWLSGAPVRYFAHRDRRSIQRLSNWPVKAEIEDRSAHHTERYAAAVRPLGIEKVGHNFVAKPSSEAEVAAAKVLDRHDSAGKRLIGLFLGAGHPTRRWPVERFVETAKEISGECEVLVLLGPEEKDMRSGLQERFGEAATVVEELPLAIFFALLARLDVFVSGDTGPMHLAAIAGAGVVLLSTKGAPPIFTPLTERLVNINDVPFEDITVDRVVTGIRKLLSEHTGSLKSPAARL
ncbi:MAG TPA: glycosyltransferase family 9 protein [Pyrinomonadaceae bacterium]|nr:glycosyltransferase family 9 protein [Pyrinomonadaceae bacterium]